ncbi:MAG: ribosome silencing factor [Burkholderiaceae bacterium]|nr:ribosome silencing factor [Burkholderiaceae bacterium]
MDLAKLQRIVVDALDDLKAQDVRVFNTTGITGMFDRVVIASGTSNRHTRSLASHVADKVKAGCGEVISIEGAETGEWVLVDAGDIVVHVMQPSIRTYYNLEEIWGVKPVRLKTGATQPKAAGGAKATKAKPASKPASPRAKAR